MSDSIVFDRAADYYDQTRGFPPGQEQHVADLLIRAGSLTPETRMLEIGIGTGRIALPLAPHMRAVYGVDLSRPMMDKLRAKQTDEPIFVAQADAARLPFPDHVFDAAVAVHVFHLIPAYVQVVQELARVLKPDGLLLHGGNEHGDEFKALDDAWEAAIPALDRTEVGVRWEQRETFLRDLGWTELGERQFVEFASTRTPQNFLDSIEQRSWSRTWRLSDEQIAAGAAAVRAAIVQHFDGDFERQVETHSGFRVHVYRPPARR